MKIMKKSGLALVLVALAALIGTLFINSYMLTRDVVEQANFSDFRKQYFLKAASTMIDREYDDKVSFVSDLKRSFNQANTHIKETLSIPRDDIDRLVKAAVNEGTIDYNLKLAEKLYDPGTETAQYRIQGINDYTGWIADRNYDNKEKLKHDITHSLENFNADIIERKGFKDYDIETYVLTFTNESTRGTVADQKTLWFLLTFILAIAGGILFAIPKFFEGKPGIKNNGIYHHPMNNRGWQGILLGAFLIAFYVVLYFYPVWFSEWIIISDVAAKSLFGREAGRWFLYGLIYTLAIAVMGIRFLTKYRHNRYQQYRTWSVIFFQLVFAFTLPQILYALNLPEVDLKNIWPLDYSFFFDYRVDNYVESGAMGISMLIWGIALIVLGVPLFTYFFGKRWYCSWVCGCGGLAETAGDPFRQLSDKRLIAWQIERWLVHGVLVFAVVMTVWVLYTTLSDTGRFFGLSSYKMREIYGFAIGSVFAGVVGTGFYPFMGNRVWCRFGCPLAAYLGLFQRFKSRFRITTNGGQCISCGNCSTYCEMGIDVRWYAQRGQNIIRSSCVGCGICAAVCPRGVLKLENKKENGRFGVPVLTGNDAIMKIEK